MVLSSLVAKGHCRGMKDVTRGLQHCFVDKLDADMGKGISLTDA